jgi:uncharacterized membrane protein YgcG
MDDVERRIADLEGRPVAPTGDGRHNRRGKKTWAGWTVFALVVLYGLQHALPIIRDRFPVMNRPAPGWVGLVVLILPFAAVAIYFIVRWRRRARRRHWATGEGRRNDDGDSGCSGGDSSCSGSDSSCSGGDSGCGGGCGGGGD